MLRGAFTFTSDGPASGRAKFNLPVAAHVVLDAQGALRPGDAACLLTRDWRDGATIYRSLYGGATWIVVSYPPPKRS